MTDIDPELVKAIVAASERVTLSDPSAKRTARSMQGTRRTLDVIAAKSMFDTEPAQFGHVMEALAAGGKRDG